MNKVKGNYVKVQLDGFQIRLNSKYKAKSFFLFNKKIENLIPVKMQYIENNVYKIFLANDLFAEFSRNIRFSLIAMINSDLCEVVNSKIASIPTWKRYLNSISSINIYGRSLIPYLSMNGNLSLYLCKKVYVDSNERGIVFKGALDQMIDQPENLIFNVNLKTIYPKNLDTITTLTLTYRRSDKNVELSPVSNKIVHKKNKWFISAKFNKKQITDNIYSDSYILVIHGKKEGQDIEYQINSISKKFYDQLHKPYRDVFKVNSTKKLLVQVSFNKALWIHYRDIQKVDLPEVRNREAIALDKYKPNQPNGNIVFFEKESQMAQDNGFALFSYLQTTHLASKVFYVIDPDSPQYDNLSAWQEQILPLFSEKYFQHIIEDPMLVASESIPHVYQFNFNFGNIIEIAREKNNYFLQHGVIGIRKLGDVFKYKRSGYDYINSSTIHEAKLVHSTLKYPRNRINVFGLPRWERLSQTKPTKTILYFPTWREKLAYLNEEQFLDSDYFKNMSDLMANEQLMTLLIKFGYKLKVFLHPKMRRFTKYLNNNDCVIITDSSQETLGNAIKNSDIVISDYSSMVWDFAYQRKPIILFQFDQMEYEKQWGGFFDMTIWDFGPIALTVNEVVQKLMEIIQNNGQMRSEYFEQMEHHLGDVNSINNKHKNFIEKTLMNKKLSNKNLSSWRRLNFHYFLIFVRQLARVVKRRILSFSKF